MAAEMTTDISFRLWNQVRFALQVHSIKTHFNWQSLNKQHWLDERRPKQSFIQAHLIF